MTKFIASVARRFAECADYLDSLQTETRDMQRAHAREITAQARSNLLSLSQLLDAERNVVTMGQATRAASYAHRTARVERNRLRARARFQKEMLREEQF
jgi:hypothetical protein